MFDNRSKRKHSSTLPHSIAQLNIDKIERLSRFSIILRINDIERFHDKIQGTTVNTSRIIRDSPEEGEHKDPLPKKHSLKTYKPFIHKYYCLGV